MRRLIYSILAGFCLTLLFYVADRYVIHPWTDKPMMPTFFTYFLLPGFEAASSFHLKGWPLTVMSGVIDSMLFGFPVWLLDIT